jgi:hypothetical protein
MKAVRETTLLTTISGWALRKELLAWRLAKFHAPFSVLFMLLKGSNGITASPRSQAGKSIPSDEYLPESSPESSND